MQYTRNRIYINPEEQQQIRNQRIFLGGCGIGSVIAECVLRLGFEQITVADGDLVEESNLNRQNYTHADIGAAKAESMDRRLSSINPASGIEHINGFLTEDNIPSMLRGCALAVNALDFQSRAPFFFDTYCQQQGIPVLHPYNIGWGALLYVITPDGPGLHTISAESEGFEKAAVRFFLESEQKKPSGGAHWVADVLREYEAEEPLQSPPQLSVGSWLLGGLCTDVLFRLATNKPVRAFPDYYFLSAR